MGQIELFMRIIGKTLFLKTNNEQYSNSMLQNLSSKGAVIIRGRGWLRIEIIPKETPLAKLGDYEIDLNKDTPEQIEIKIANFFKEKYVQAGFTLI